MDISVGNCGRTNEAEWVGSHPTEVYTLGGGSHSAQCSLSALAPDTAEALRWHSWMKAQIGMSVHFFAIGLGHRNFIFSIDHTVLGSPQHPPLFLACSTIPWHGLRSLGRAYTLLGPYLWNQSIYLAMVVEMLQFVGISFALWVILSGMIIFPLYPQIILIFFPEFIFFQARKWSLCLGLPEFS